MSALKQAEEKNRTDGEEPSVWVGPVIGHTTHESTRVLLEVSAAASVTCVLTSREDPSDTHAETVEFPAGRPRVFKFGALRAATTYDLALEGVADAGAHPGRVRTFDPDAAALTVIVGACDKPKRRGKTDMYEVMWRDYVEPGEVHVVVRHGDQVYADDAFHAGCKLYTAKKHRELTDDERRERTAEEFRKIYRKTWGGDTYTARVLAHVPHLMLGDDHEGGANDQGTLPGDRDPSTLRYRVCLIGVRVYHEYQRQLWQDLDDVPPLDDPRSGGVETHIHRWGAFGVSLIDTRGPRSYGFVDGDEGTYIGSKNWRMLEEAVAEGGALDGCRALLAVHSMPLVWLGTRASRCLTCSAPLVDKLGIGLNPDEQGRYIRWLGEHFKSADGDRDVVIVGGDLHIGFRTRITDPQTGHEFRQIIATPVCNRPPPGAVNKLIGCFCMGCCCSGIGNGLKFEHEQQVYAKNFGVVRATLNGGDDGQTVVMTDELVLFK